MHHFLPLKRVQFQIAGGFWKSVLCGLLVLTGARCLHAQSAPPAASVDPIPERVGFNEHIRPIFASHCVKCHGGVKQAGGLSFIYRDLVLAGGDSGLAAVTPGSVEESYLVDRISDPDPDSRMPPADQGPPLDSRQVELIKKWIEQGANWEETWSFTPPHPASPPKTHNSQWVRQPLDAYVLAKMESAGLSPSPAASKSAWLRRVYFDLTGLPPSAADYQDFEGDDSPQARERVVDRLLASPRFGERWAAMWLDLARYADTMGFEKDPHRNIWPYRDWVIRALNADMPFDEFTIKQLAGDLLPHATIGDRLATAFHRNTQTNTEGGTDDEEYRTAAVIDRTNSTWLAWQGITFGCAQCHSHPYEPIENKEYYRFLAFFDNTQDRDVNEEYPLLSTPLDEKEWPRAEQLDEQSADIRRQLFDRYWHAAKGESTWMRMAPQAAKATGETKLAIRTCPDDGVAEVQTEGTVSAFGTFTIELSTEGIQQLTAIRVEALPRNASDALKIPENGFVVSRLTARLKGEKRSTDVKFALVFCDDPAPAFDPQESLEDNDRGWGAYSRLSRPCTAIFVLDQPLEVNRGDVLQLDLKFDRTDSGVGALAIQRARFSATGGKELSNLTSEGKCSELRSKLAELASQRATIASLAVPVIQDLPSEVARHTYTFIRGSWLSRDAEVAPGVPKVLPPLPDGPPADRLALAKWLVSPDNPLTARVMVNRLWSELFGVGIVETVEDFGISGAKPSNQELLDHLALRFQNECHWSLKQILREMTLSATYGQDNATTPEKLQADPRNQLLCRGPRTRLTAEMVRDQALALAGRLSTKMFGAPVMPPQPSGVWRSVYNSAVWKTSAGEDRYRRAIYTYCKRTSGYPSLLTFDMPARDVCTARRIATNTPLQALVTLNDEVYIELAQGLADRMAGAGPDASDQIASGYYIAVGRTPTKNRLDRLEALYDAATAEFDANPEASHPLASTRGRYGLTIVANALLNLDELLTK